MKIDIKGMENLHQEEKVKREPMGILIVDDEIEILGSYKAFFEGKWRDVITAANGCKCIDASKRFSQKGTRNYFDVIIPDQKMPFMTGLQASVKILEINPTSKNNFCFRMSWKNTRSIDKDRQSNRSNRKTIFTWCVKLCDKQFRDIWQIRKSQYQSKRKRLQWKYDRNYDRFTKPDLKNQDVKISEDIYLK